MAAISTNGNRGALVLGLAWLVVFSVVGGSLAWAQYLAGPLISEDVISLFLPARPAAKPAKVAPPLPVLYETPPGGILPANLSDAEKAALAAAPPPQAVETAPPPVPVTITPPPGGPAVANPALLEKTPSGFLPRVAEGGLTPLRAYAAPIPGGTRPRIAIVIGGLGISAKATQAAINGLPASVTLAFVPYANDVQRWVMLARQKGHEVLLQVPMEPYDFPDSDPGQYTLRSAFSEEGNIKRLDWSLGRMSGYVGVTNLLGGRFLSDSHAVEPVFTYLMRRGLMFYDNGTATRSVSQDVANRLGVPFVQAFTAIDSIQASMEIDHRLADLEAEARSKGSASGTGFIYPVTMERVTLWAKSLSGRGFVLAPISAIVLAQKK